MAGWDAYIRPMSNTDTARRRKRLAKETTSHPLADEDLVNKEGAARLLGMSVRQVDRLMERGLPVIRPPGTIKCLRFRVGSLRAWMRAYESGDVR